MPASLDVPPLVRERAASNGVAGQRWLDDLPELVAALADKWGLELGRSFPGGTAAFVAAATDRSGRACVLKVAMPLDMDDGDSFARSAAPRSALASHSAPPTPGSRRARIVLDARSPTGS